MNKLDEFRKDILEKIITKSCIGKKYLVDNHHDMVVKIKDIRADGWIDVLDQNGTTISYNPERLTPIDESKLLNRIIDEVEDTNKLYVLYVDKIIVTGRTKDGSVIEQVLEGEQAEQWHNFTQALSIFADVHGVNPDFHTLKWKKKITKKA